MLLALLLLFTLLALWHICLYTIYWDFGSAGWDRWTDHTPQTVINTGAPCCSANLDDFSNLCCGDDRGLSRKKSGADSNDSRPTEVCLHYIRTVGDLKFYSICIQFVFSAHGSPAEVNLCHV